MHAVAVFLDGKNEADVLIVGDYLGGCAAGFALVRSGLWVVRLGYGNACRNSFGPLSVFGNMAKIAAIYLWKV